MKIDFKDWLTWVRVCAIVLISSMYLWSLPTLKLWAWGYWSIEYLVTGATLLVYIWWDNMITTNRRLYRIENKLNSVLRGKGV